MKMKKLLIALALVTSTSLSYASLTADQQATINGSVGLAVSEIVERTQQYPDLAFAIYEALAKNSPETSASLASQLASAAPDQAATIASGMISGVDGDIELSLAIVNAVKAAAPAQSEQVNNQVADIIIHSFNRSVAHFDKFNDTPATVSYLQQFANNMQAAIDQGLIHQSLAEGEVRDTLFSLRKVGAIALEHGHISVSPN